MVSIAVQQVCLSSYHCGVHQMSYNRRQSCSKLVFMVNLVPSLFIHTLTSFITCSFAPVAVNADFACVELRHSLSKKDLSGAGDPRLAGTQAQLQTLGQDHVGFSCKQFPAHRMSVVGARPFSAVSWLAYVLRTRVSTFCEHACVHGVQPQH